MNVRTGKVDEMTENGTSAVARTNASAKLMILLM